MLNETLNKISRLMYILNGLDKGEISVSSMARDLNVTLRTIQRDLRILEEAGFPFANTKKGFYCFVEGFSLQRMRVSAQEAAMLALLGEMARSLGSNFADTVIENDIYFRRHHHNIHTEIKPQHDEGDRRQASIHGKTVKIIHIDGNTDRKNIKIY